MAVVAWVAVAGSWTTPAPASAANQDPPLDLATIVVESPGPGFTLDTTWPYNGMLSAAQVDSLLGTASSGATSVLVGAYARRWQRPRPPGSAVVFAFELPAASAATAFIGAVHDTANGAHDPPFAVPGVPGAFGYVASTPGGPAQAIVAFSKGRAAFMVDVNQEPLPTDQADATQLATVQLARVPPAALNDLVKGGSGSSGGSAGVAGALGHFVGGALVIGFIVFVIVRVQRRDHKPGTA